MSPHLRKRVKETAEKSYFFGLAETPHMAAFLRVAALEKLERDSVRIEEAEKRFK